MSDERDKRTEEERVLRRFEPYRDIINNLRNQPDDENTERPRREEPPPMTNSAGEMTARPTGSNADEWHLFLCERLDNRVNHPNGLTYVAVQIAEAIEAARSPEAAGARREEYARALADCHGHREIKPQDYDEADAILALPAPSAPPPHSQASEVVEALEQIKNLSSGLTGRHGGWETIHEIAKAALSRQAPQPAAAMPSGEWQLVPQFPTLEMLKAGGEARKYPDADGNTLATWYAMLDAAPSAQGKA